MSVKVRDVDLRVLNMRTRMPFRYGIASMTALPHLFVRCTVEVDGTARSFWARRSSSCSGRYRTESAASRS